MPEMAPKRSLCRLASSVLPDFCGVTIGFTAGKVRDSSFTVCQGGERQETIEDDFKGFTNSSWKCEGEYKNRTEQPGMLNVPEWEEDSGGWGSEKEQEEGARGTSGLGRAGKPWPMKFCISPGGLAPFPFQSSDAQHFCRLFPYVSSFRRSLTCSF